MPGKLQDKIVLITGSGTGIGRAICYKFVFEGAKVICVDIDEEAGQSTAAMFSTSAIYVRGNVAVEGDWSNALSKGVARYGKIDIVVNNAGIMYESQVSKADHSHLCKFGSTNVYTYSTGWFSLRKVSQRRSLTD